MKEEDKGIDKQIKEAIEKALRGIPFLTVEQLTNSSQDSSIADIVYRISDGARSKFLAIEVKSTGEPRYVRRAVQQMQGLISRRNYDAYCMIAAPYISEDAGRICKENRMGYIDLAGNCFINFGQVYIERTNFPNPQVLKRTQRSIFTKKATRILRVLLCNQKRSWQVQELAKESNVSIGLAFKIKERLLDLEYIEEQQGNLILIRPQELLTKWTENYTYRKNRLYDFYSLKDIRQLEQSLSKYCEKRQISYAFTLFSGAFLVAPYTKYVRGFAYVTDNIREIAEALELKTVETGANFTLMESYDDGVFYGSRKIENYTVVSDIQLYLDLVNFKGRGEEAAQFLFDQKIKPQW